MQSQNDVYQSWILLIAFSRVNGKCPYFPHCLNLVVKWCTSQVIVVLIRLFMRDLYQSCGYAGDILFPLMLLKSIGNLKENFCGKLLAVFSFSHSKISIFICHLSANYNVLTTTCRKLAIWFWFTWTHKVILFFTFVHTTANDIINTKSFQCKLKDKDFDYFMYI